MVNCHDLDSHDDEKSHNQGWQWSYSLPLQARSGDPPTYVHDEMLEGQRRWGYEIWDDERLRGLGLLIKGKSASLLPHRPHY